MRVQPLEDMQELKKEIEEAKTIGTWTPTITTVENAAPTIEYTDRRGIYIKIGRLVYIEFYIRRKNNGT